MVPALFMQHRFDRIYGDPVKGRIAGVDELVSYTAGHKDGVTRFDRVLLPGTHQDASTLCDERLVLPFVNVVGTGFRRSASMGQAVVGDVG